MTPQADGDDLVRVKKIDPNTPRAGWYYLDDNLAIWKILSANPGGITARVVVSAKGVPMGKVTTISFHSPVKVMSPQVFEAYREETRQEAKGEDAGPRCPCGHELLCHEVQVVAGTAQVGRCMACTCEAYRLPTVGELASKKATL